MIVSSADHDRSRRPAAGRAVDVAAAAPIANQVGVRLISPDRPGIGLSDPLPGRTVLDGALRHRVTRVAIVAGEDQLLDPGWPHELARRIPNATLNIRAGGHFLAHRCYREILEALCR